MSDERIGILLLDDDITVRVPLKTYLQNTFGYEIDDVATGAEALDLLETRARHYDVALIDEVLQENPDGIAIAQVIRSRYPAIEYIIFTGWNTDGRQRAIEAGAYRYLQKPFDKGELAMLIRSAAQQVRLQAIGREIMAELNLGRALSQISAAASSLALADEASIVLLDEMSNRLRLHSASSPSQHHWKRHYVKRDLSREIIQSGLLHTVPRVEAGEGFDPNLVASGVRSFVGVPIPGEKSNLGVLYVYSDKAGHFNAWGTVPLLQTLASQAGLAINNARAFEQTQRHAATMEALVQAAQALSRAGSEEERFALAWNFVRVQLGASTFFIALIDEDQALLRFPLVYDDGNAVDVAARPLFEVSGKPCASAYVARHQSELAWDSSDERDGLSVDLGLEPVISGQACESCVYLPLTISMGTRTARGVVSIQSPARSAFGELPRNAFRALCVQLATTLGNTRLYEAAQTRLRDLETLHHYALALNSTLSLDDTLAAACRSAVELLRADHSGLVIFDDDGASGWVEAEYPTDLGTVGTRIPMRGVAVEEQLIDQQAPQIVEDVASAEDLKAVRDILFYSFGIQSIMIVPIVRQGRAIGSLSIDAIKQKRHFTDQDVELCRLLAEQVAEAIENARRLDESSVRGKQLATLDDYIRYIRAEDDLPKLQHAVTRLGLELVQCNTGLLLENFSHLQEMQVSAVYDLPRELQGKRLRHADSALGRMALDGAAVFIPDYATWPERDPLLDLYHFRSAFIVPLRHAGEVMAVLLVANTNPDRECVAEDLEIIERFAKHAAIALQTAQLLGTEQRRWAQLSILHRISDYIQQAGDVDKILHVVLTGVTAGYGLGFNRAALFLIDDAGRALHGRLGIGNLDDASAREDWRLDQAQGRYDFGNYIKLLENDDLPLTPIGETICQVAVPVAASQTHAMQRALQEGREILATADEVDGLPPAFVAAFAPAAPLVIAPLMARGRAIGLLIADNKFTRSPVTSESIEHLMTFANTAAIAISNAQLIHETTRAREQLRELFAASNALALSENPAAVLKDILKRTIAAARATWASVILIDELGRVQDLVIENNDRQFDPETVIRPRGISIQVMTSGKPVAIEDVNQFAGSLNPSIWENKIGAALCLPVSLQGKRIGVMWIHYSEPHAMPTWQVEALQFYVNQAAIAYGNARRVDELKRMRQALEMMSAAHRLPQARQAIVEGAGLVFKADSVAIWPYDDKRGKFIPGELVFAGISDEDQEQFRQQEPGRGRTANKIMADGTLQVHDLADARFEFLGRSTHDLLARINVKAFQAVLMHLGDEKLGILYVNYQKPRAFSENDGNMLRTFADHAALAIKSAQLLAQMERTRTAAGTIAGVTGQERLSQTLQTITTNTRLVLNADTVNLYVYNEASHRFTHLSTDNPDPLTPDSATPAEDLHAHSVVWHILQLEGPPFYRLAEDNAGDDNHLGGRFVRSEGIQASLGIVLRVGTGRVGVMFVNFRSAHRFTSDEIETIQLFADQAAMAVRNTQLYAEATHRAATLQALYNSGQAITQSLTIHETLHRIAQQARVIAGGENDKRCFSLVALKTGNRLRFVAADDDDTLVKLNDRVKFIDLDGDSPVGITGRVAITGTAAHVTDIGHDPDYIPFEPSTRCEIAVPIKVDERVIGVIDVEHSVANAFSAETVQSLTNLAAQAAVAVQNARLFEHTRSAADITRQAAQSLELDDFLNTLFMNLRAVFETQMIPVRLRLAIYSNKTHSLVYQPSSDYAEVAGPDVVARNAKGIMVWVAATRRPHYAKDCAHDAHYQAILQDTRSEMAAPIVFNDELLGVLGVASPLADAFPPEDLLFLQMVAAQVATTMRSIGQYRELQQTKGLVGARTALAWMGMVSSEWRHRIRNQAQTIEDEVELLNRHLQRQTPDQDDYATTHLRKIRGIADQIKEKPIIPPLSAEEGVSLIYINDLLAERVAQLRAYGEYTSVDLGTDLRAPPTTTVSASPEWLRRALDILIDNAVNAVAGKALRRVTIATHVVASTIEIKVSDTGTGIAPEIKRMLFSKPVHDAGDTHGLGIGLLIAEAIVSTYHGTIGIEKTDDDGTTMVIILPCAEQSAPIRPTTI